MRHHFFTQNTLVLTSTQNNNAITEYTYKNIEMSLKDIENFIDLLKTHINKEYSTPISLNLNDILKDIFNEFYDENEKIILYKTNLENSITQLKNIVSLTICVTDLEKDMSVFKKIIKSQSNIKQINIEFTNYNNDDDNIYYIHEIIKILSESNNPIKSLNISFFLNDSYIFENNTNYINIVDDLFKCLSKITTLETFYFSSMERFFYFEFLFKHVTSLKKLTLEQANPLSYELLNKDDEERLARYNDIINALINSIMHASQLEYIDLDLNLSTQPRDVIKANIDQSHKNLHIEHIELECEYLFNFMNIVLYTNKKIKKITQELEKNAVDFDHLNQYFEQFETAKNDLLESIDSEKNRFKQILSAIFDFINTEQNNLSDYSLLQDLELFDSIIQLDLIDIFLFIKSTDFIKRSYQLMTAYYSQIKGPIDTSNIQNQFYQMKSKLLQWNNPNHINKVNLTELNHHLDLNLHLILAQHGHEFAYLYFERQPKKNPNACLLFAKYFINHLDSLKKNAFKENSTLKMYQFILIFLLDSYKHSKEKHVATIIDTVIGQMFQFVQQEYPQISGMKQPQWVTHQTLSNVLYNSLNERTTYVDPNNLEKLLILYLSFKDHCTWDIILTLYKEPLFLNKIEQCFGTSIILPLEFIIMAPDLSLMIDKQKKDLLTSSNPKLQIPYHTFERSLKSEFNVDILKTISTLQCQTVINVNNNAINSPNSDTTHHVNKRKTSTYEQDTKQATEEAVEKGLFSNTHPKKQKNDDTQTTSTATTVSQNHPPSLGKKTA